MRQSVVMKCFVCNLVEKINSLAEYSHEESTLREPFKLGYFYHRGKVNAYIAVADMILEDNPEE